MAVPRFFWYRHMLIGAYHAADHLDHSIFRIKAQPESSNFWLVTCRGSGYWFWFCQFSLDLNTAMICSCLSQMSMPTAKWMQLLCTDMHPLPGVFLLCISFPCQHLDIQITARKQHMGPSQDTTRCCLWVIVHACATTLTAATCTKFPDMASSRKKLLRNGLVLAIVVLLSDPLTMYVIANSNVLRLSHIEGLGSAQRSPLISSLG